MRMGAAHDDAVGRAGRAMIVRIAAGSGHETSILDTTDGWPTPNFMGRMKTPIGWAGYERPKDEVKGRRGGIALRAAIRRRARPLRPNP